MGSNNVDVIDLTGSPPRPKRPYSALEITDADHGNLPSQPKRHRRPTRRNRSKSVLDDELEDEIQEVHCVMNGSGIGSKRVQHDDISGDEEPKRTRRRSILDEDDDSEDEDGVFGRNNGNGNRKRVVAKSPSVPKAFSFAKKPKSTFKERLTGLKARRNLEKEFLDTTPPPSPPSTSYKDRIAGLRKTAEKAPQPRALIRRNTAPKPPGVKERPDKIASQPEGLVDKEKGGSTKVEKLPSATDKKVIIPGVKVNKESLKMAMLEDDYSKLLAVIDSGNPQLLAALSGVYKRCVICKRHYSNETECCIREHQVDEWTKFKLAGNRAGGNCTVCSVRMEAECAANGKPVRDRFGVCYKGFHTSDSKVIGKMHAKMSACIVSDRRI